MENYKLTVSIPEHYRKHIEVLKGQMRKKTNESVIKELIDERMASYF